MVSEPAQNSANLRLTTQSMVAEMLADESIRRKANDAADESPGQIPNKDAVAKNSVHAQLKVLYARLYWFEDKAHPAKQDMGSAVIEPDQAVLERGEAVRERDRANMERDEAVRKLGVAMIAKPRDGFRRCGMLLTST